MAGDAYSLRVDIDWSDATRDTTQFISNVNNAIRSVLSSAQSVGSPEASQDAGRQLERLRADARALGRELEKAFDVSLDLDTSVLAGLNKLLDPRRGGSLRGVPFGVDIGEGRPGTLATAGLTSGLHGRALARGAEQERTAILAGRILSEPSRELDRFSAELREASAAANGATNSFHNVKYQRNPSLFQRGYAAVTGSGDPSAAPRGRQFIASRAFNTIGYGLTGGLLYGGLSQAGQMIREATELEVQLGILESQFDSLGGTVDGVTFDGFRDSILRTARETGVAADEVANVERQLAGAFANIQNPGTPQEQVVPDFAAANEVANIALRLGKITGLPQQEITDTFSASVLAFREEGESAVDTAQRLADAVVGLEARFGVGSTEILNFTASLASMASESGFSIEQLAGFGAVVEQAVGSDVAASENVGRIFASLQDNQIKIAQLFADNDLGEYIDPLITGFAEGDLPGVLRALVGAYGELKGTAAAGELTNLVGGDRQARTFAAVMDRGSQILNALNTEVGDFDGSFDARWARYSETVQLAFDQMRRALEEFGIALFESGLKDALLLVADAGEDVASVAKLLLGVFRDLNDATDGWVVKLGLAAGALYAFGAIGGAAGGGGGKLARATAFMLPFANTGGFGTRPGGLLSGYSTPGPIQTINPRIANSALLRRIAGYDLAPPPLSGGPASPILTGGKFRLAAAGAVAGAAPLIATASIAAILSTAQSVGEETQAAADSLESEVAARVAAGVSPADIRRSIEGANVDVSGGPRPLRNLLNNFTYGLLGHGKDPVQTALDEVGRLEAEGYLNNQLDYLAENVTNADLQRSGVRLARNDGGPSAPNVEEFRAIIADFKSDPENNAKRQLIDDLMFSLAQLDSETSNGIFAIQEEYATRLAGANDLMNAVEALDSPENTEALATLGELEIEYNAGNIGKSEYLAAVEVQITLLQAAVDASRASGKVNLDFLKQLRDMQQAANEIIEGERNALIDIQMAVLDFGPAADTEGALTQRLSLLGQRLRRTDDPEDAAAVAQQMLDLQQSYFQARIDDAESIEDAEAIAAGGYTLNEQALTALAAAQLRLGDNESVLSEVADAIGVDLDRLSTAVADQVVSLGLDAKEVLNNVIDGYTRLAFARLQMNRTVSGYLEFARRMGELSAARGEINNVDLVLPTDSDANAPGVQGTGTTPDRSAEEQRREAMERQNALLDLEAARAQGDAIALAAIARRRAEVALRYADGETERLQAFAQLEEANNQLREAYEAAGQAQSDLRVVQSFDDPITAANEARDRAQIAVENAHGIEQQARAEADRIRAEVAQRDAVLALADAQSDVLTAMAERTGDTVAAARAAVESIDRELARPDLNPTRRAELDAERIRAVTAVGDAQLSEAQDLIDFNLQMGNITTRQAIAQLRGLLQLADSDEETRALLLRIDQLSKGLGSEFQFNLPTQLGLPVLYEARRTGQSGGSGGYQDNRNTTVNVYATTNADPKAIGDAVAYAVGDPRVYGTSPRRY